MEKQNKEKMNLSFAPDIKEYLVSQSETCGMSVSSFLTMLVCIYRKEQEDNAAALLNGSNLLEEIERLKKLIPVNPLPKQPTI